MWYFSWILGLGLACSFSILNAMWLEMKAYRDIEEEQAEKENSILPKT